MPRQTRNTLLLALVVSATMFGGGCTNNPATGRSQFLLMSAEEEIALGTEAKPELTKEYGGEVASRDLRDYVTWVGDKLAKQVEDQYRDLPWEFTVLDSDVINAFALPGGKVFISRGLMWYMHDEAELAAALGHEIGHVTAQHADERISQAMVLNGIAVTAGVAGQDSWIGEVVPLVVGVGGQGYLLKFGRDQESEADRQGLKYMTRAGYDPIGMVNLLNVLVATSSGTSPPEMLSTHPDPERRVAEATELIETTYGGMHGSEDYATYRRRWDRRAAPYLPRPASANAGLAPFGAAYWCAACRAETSVSDAGSRFVETGGYSGR